VKETCKIDARGKTQEEKCDKATLEKTHSRDVTGANKQQSRGEKIINSR